MTDLDQLLEVFKYREIGYLAPNHAEGLPGQISTPYVRFYRLTQNCQIWH